MRNALNKLVETVKDPAEKQVRHRNLRCLDARV